MQFGKAGEAGFAGVDPFPVIDGEFATEAPVQSVESGGEGFVQDRRGQEGAGDFDQAQPIAMMEGGFHAGAPQDLVSGTRKRTAAGKVRGRGSA